MPSRIQRQRTKGWRMPDGAVYVGRPSRWGNPFCIGGPVGYPYNVALPLPAHVRDAAHAVELFRAYARITSGYELVVRHELAGRELVCWCPLPAPGEPDLCHADVLLEIANRELPDGT